MRTLVAVVTVLIATLAPDGTTFAQQSTWVADITAAPQRYWNRDVLLEGQVTEVRADPVGTRRGYYVLVDESSEEGIVVRSRALPAPGEMVEVRGHVIQDPDNAAVPMIQESERDLAGRPAWLLPLIIGSAALAVVLLVALVVTLVRGSREDDVAPAHRAPATGPGAAPGSHARASTDSDQETVAYRPPSDAEKTQVFRKLGATVEVVEGPDKGKEYAVGASPFLIGRDGGRRQNHVVLSDSTVSRAQAKIIVDEEEGRFSLVNESRTNPTEVGDAPVEIAELDDGDEIRFGSSVLRFKRSES